MKTIQLFLILAIANFSNAQDFNYEISNTYINKFGKNTDLVGFIPLFKLDSNLIHNRESSATIKQFPKTINRSKTAYCFVYFTGMKNSIFKTALTLLVENYETMSPTIYVDRNGNLDFTDDGPPLKLNDKLILKLANSDDNSANYHYQIAKSQISKKNEDKIKNRYASKFPKNNIISPGNWLTNQRLFVRISKGIIDNNPITIFLIDNTADGLFTFDTHELGDRILITEGEVNEDVDLSSYFRQAEPIDHNAIFELYGKKYSVKKTSRNGETLTIAETNKNTRAIFKEGHDVSSLKIELLNGTLVSIKDLIKEEKPLLIDVGGTWCGGCISQERTIKYIYENMDIEVLGVFDYDTRQSVTKYVNKHKLEWPVALIDSNFKNIFRINSYPTYILISSKGEIILVDHNSEQIAKYLKS